MAYFIFNKIDGDLSGCLYRIAENNNDLNNINVNINDYKIIEDNNVSFEDIKLNKKIFNKYINNSMTFLDQSIVFENKKELSDYVDTVKKKIKEFTDNNLNHPLYNNWNNYYNQLNSLNLDNITYPLNKSLEQYFKDLGQISLNTLQLP